MKPQINHDKTGNSLARLGTKTRKSRAKNQTISITKVWINMEKARLTHWYFRLFTVRVEQDKPEDVTHPFFTAEQLSCEPIESTNQSMDQHHASISVNFPGLNSGSVPLIVRGL